MKAKVIFYSQKKIKPNLRTKFKKELTGHNDSSHGGNYKYRIKGILDKIQSIKPCNATLIIKNIDLSKVTSIMDKYGVEYTSYTIEIKKNDFIK